MADHQIELRDGILTVLRNRAELVALVPAARIYSEQPPSTPSWPFIRWGFPIVAPSRASCWVLATYDLSLHVFAKDTAAVGGFDNAHAIARQVVAALDDQDILMDGPGGLTLLAHSQSLTLRDSAEAGAYHVVVSFDAATAEVVA